MFKIKTRYYFEFTFYGQKNKLNTPKTEVWNLMTLTLTDKF